LKGDKEMRKYKTGEAIAMLEKNPKLRFKNQENYGLSVNEDNGCLILKYYSDIISDNNNIRIADCNKFKADEWELIQQPVDFLTAVKAYSEGKTIRSEQEDGASEIYSCKCGIISMFEGEKGTILNCKEVLKAKWYIEGESNA
jgi:hypothetical protein